MEDHDRLNNLEGGETPGDPPKIQSTEGEGTPIPSRIRDAMHDVKRRMSEELHNTRDVVEEYEERYHGSRRRLEDSGPPPARVVAPYKAKRHHDPASVDANERKWATLAHASTLLTALVALGSAGAGVLITMFVPLLIYFAFRNRSEYVAFHALQAFTIQLVGTIGFVGLILAGTFMWVILLILSALLLIVLVGIVLLPLVIIAYPIFILATLLLPLGMTVYSVIAAIETWGGRNYRIPFVARWVENQMHGGWVSNL
jgi:uncharacterized Tic20 family protein